MDTKQLVDKFINGEITEAEFDTETSKLSPEDKKKLEDEAKVKIPDAVEKLKGVRRGIDKISSEKNATFETKIQKENLEAAKTQFFQEYGIEKDEDKQSFQQDFKTESVNVTNIIRDMKSHYVAKNPDRYLDLEKKQRESQKAADEFTAQNAGGGGNGGGGDKKNGVISKEVKEYMEASRKAGRTVTPEFAQKALSMAKNKGKIPTS